MRKVEVEFLNLSCMGIKVSHARLIEGLDVFHYSGWNLPFGRRQANGKFKIVQEDDIAMEYLQKGKGVLYKDYIFFAMNGLETNPYYENFQKRYQRFLERLHKKIGGEEALYVDLVLLESLKESSLFEMVKSMVNLYKMGIFTEETLLKKLSPYLTEEGIQKVRIALHEEREMAG